MRYRRIRERSDPLMCLLYGVGWTMSSSEPEWEESSEGGQGVAAAEQTANNKAFDSLSIIRSKVNSSISHRYVSLSVMSIVVQRKQSTPVDIVIPVPRLAGQPRNKQSSFPDVAAAEEKVEQSLEFARKLYSRNSRCSAWEELERQLVSTAQGKPNCLWNFAEEFITGHDTMSILKWGNQSTHLRPSSRSIPEMLYLYMMFDDYYRADTFSLPPDERCNFIRSRYMKGLTSWANGEHVFSRMEDFSSLICLCDLPNVMTDVDFQKPPEGWLNGFPQEDSDPMDVDGFDIPAPSVVSQAISSDMLSSYVDYLDTELQSGGDDYFCRNSVSNFVRTLPKPESGVDNDRLLGTWMSTCEKPRYPGTVNVDDEKWNALLRVCVDRRLWDAALAITSNMSLSSWTASLVASIFGMNRILGTEDLIFQLECASFSEMWKQGTIDRDPLCAIEESLDHPGAVPMGIHPDVRMDEQDPYCSHESLYQSDKDIAHCRFGTIIPGLPLAPATIDSTFSFQIGTTPPFRGYSSSVDEVDGNETTDNGDVQHDPLLELYVRARDDLYKRTNFKARDPEPAFHLWMGDCQLLDDNPSLAVAVIKANWEQYTSSFEQDADNWCPRSAVPSQALLNIGRCLFAIHRLCLALCTRFEPAELVSQVFMTMVYWHYDKLGHMLDQRETDDSNPTFAVSSFDVESDRLTRGHWSYSTRGEMNGTAKWKTTTSSIFYDFFSVFPAYNLCDVAFKAYAMLTEFKRQDNLHPVRLLYKHIMNLGKTLRYVQGCANLEFCGCSGCAVIQAKDSSASSSSPLPLAGTRRQRALVSSLINCVTMVLLRVSVSQRKAQHHFLDGLLSAYANMAELVPAMFTHDARNHFGMILAPMVMGMERGCAELGDALSRRKGSGKACALTEAYFANGCMSVGRHAAVLDCIYISGFTLLAELWYRFLPMTPFPFWRYRWLDPTSSDLRRTRCHFVTADTVSLLSTALSLMSGAVCRSNAQIRSRNMSPVNTYVKQLLQMSDFSAKDSLTARNENEGAAEWSSTTYGQTAMFLFVCTLFIKSVHRQLHPVPSASNGAASSSAPNPPASSQTGTANTTELSDSLKLYRDFFEPKALDIYRDRGGLCLSWENDTSPHTADLIGLAAIRKNGPVSPQACCCSRFAPVVIDTTGPATPSETIPGTAINTSNQQPVNNQSAMSSSS